RHQKIIGESRPPGLSREALQALGGARMYIRAAARDRSPRTGAAPTPRGRGHFLEMHPRRPGGHGITEAIAGGDPARHQLRIDRGESSAETPCAERGVAIEARICAEDPEAGFVPAPGRIARFDAALGPGIRVDSGVVAGSTIPAAFDSLIAKVIATGDSRE